MKILIAEDDYTSRAMLSAMLKKNGHEVIETSNGQEALNALQLENAPKLILLDWMMPLLNGIDVTLTIRNTIQDLPPYIIMLSARGEKADIIKGLNAGADDYLAKPFHLGELQARVNVGQRFVEMQDELHKIQNILAHESRHDHLTGVLNRRAIEDILNIEVTRAHRQKLDLAIGICDIDSFKQVNDTYGHLVGDDVLCSITNRLQTCLRDYDYLARFGGEEFIILAPGLKAKDRLQFFERLRKAIEEEPLNTRNGKVKITISIGVHNLRQQDSIDSLLSTADNALYKAKKAGRNLVYCEE